MIHSSGLTALAHDKDTARDFLACLDPTASKFTFQFFSDGPGSYAEIFHGTLDEVWPKVQALNTPERAVGVFFTVNETDFKGRRAENIIRPRALFADADSKEQIARCIETLDACGATPSMVVKSGRGMHFYYLCPDIPRDHFSAYQRSLIDKLGTDPAVNDLPRVMRLPGTWHLKDSTKPRLVKLHPTNMLPRRWKFSELRATLGLSLTEPAAPNRPQRLPEAFTLVARERLQQLFGHKHFETGAEGLETDMEEIRSAVSAIPSSAITGEPDWMKLARGLAHEAALFEHHDAQLWRLLDTASRRAPRYDEADNHDRWLRYKDEALNRDKPITIATVFDIARKHGWEGWSPPVGMDHQSAATASEPIAWHPVSFSNIPHRKWLYGIDLVRGEITVQGAPGGAGKTSLTISVRTTSHGVSLQLHVGKCRVLQVRASLEKKWCRSASVRFESA